MGEYADMAIDAGWDEPVWDIDYGTGQEVRDSFSSRALRGRRRSPAKTCNRCGAFPLFWGQTEAGWRLHAYTGNAAVVHACSAPTQAAPPPLADGVGQRGPTSTTGADDAPGTNTTSSPSPNLKASLHER